MTEKPEDPERVGRPPIGLVAIENDGRVGRNAIPRGKLGKRVGGNVVPLHGIVQVRTPIDMNGIRDMAGVVKKNIFVAFDDADARVIEMLGEPGGFDEAFGTCVSAHMKFWIYVCGLRGASLVDA